MAATDNLKKLHECLDIVLRQLVIDWENYGDDRKELDNQKILTEFGLQEPWLKHEFFVGIIDRLIKDGYAALIKSRTSDSEISNYQKNTIITITGYYFIKKQGGYTKQARLKWITELPKRFWWVLGILAFLAGLYSDTIKTLVNPKRTPKSEQVLPTYVDTHQNHKTHPDSLYLLNDTIYVKPLNQ